MQRQGMYVLEELFINRLTQLRMKKEFLPEK